MFNGDIVLLRSRRLQYTLLLLLTLFIVTAVAVLSTRSIWIDEAMLLRSVYEIGVLDFLHPLPYYDQASPFLFTVFIKVASEIAGTDFILFRILIFTFTFACAAPLVLKIRRSYKLHALLAFAGISAASVYNILFHVTEIKHYAFEIGAVFIFLYWLLMYVNHTENSLTFPYIFAPLFAISMGFSTLLLAPAFFLFVVVDWALRLKGQISPKRVAKNHGLIFVLMVGTVTVMYGQMTYLTTFQLNNTWSSDTYGSRGLVEDFLFFMHIIKETYTRNFLIIFGIVSLFAFFAGGNSTSFRLNLFFLSLVAIVFILKFAGFYPVVATRHIVWLIPINITITAVLLHGLSLSNKKIYYILSTFLMFNVGALLIKEGSRINRGFTAEYQNNNALYITLENMESSDILVFGHARPSLEIYQRKNIALSKHRYFGLMPGGDVSAIRVPPDAAFAGGPLREEEFTDWQFTQLPQTRVFFLLISHSHPIDQEPASDRIRAVRNTLSKNGCEHEPMFTAKEVQIVKVSCAPPGEDE